MKAFIQRWYQHYQDDKIARQNALLCQGTGLNAKGVNKAFAEMDNKKSWAQALSDGVDYASEQERVRRYYGH